MDNITHSFIGIVLSELIVAPAAPKTLRRVFAAAGVIASNAPDFDLLYVGVTPFPLGYLLHHRGHTHTVLGLVVQLVMLALAWELVERWQARRHARSRVMADAAETPHGVDRGTRAARLGSTRARRWLLLGVALGSHVAMDATNNYGVHPFHPFDSRWYYGDALFIFEPWLWLLLTVAAGLASERRWVRVMCFVPMSALFIGLAFSTVISVSALVALLAAGVGLVWWTRPWTPRQRAVGTAIASLGFVAVMLMLSAIVRAETRTRLALETRGTTLVDIALTPNPASPACWMVIVIERDERQGTFITRRGTLSLWPSWQAPASCASHRLSGLRVTSQSADGRLVWSDEVHESLASLRSLAARDCWVAAWLQFGRVPILREHEMFDLRFENETGRNFSAMSLQPRGLASACPAHLTDWARPRADLLR